MPTRNGKVALLSTDDKTDIARIAETLYEGNHRIIASGGTRKAIEEGGIRVTDVSEWTGFPPILNHRLVTYSAQVGAGLLADMSDEQHVRDMAEHGFEAIDFVYFGLYDFEERIGKLEDGPGLTWKGIVENMDVGGPAALCAAAKGARCVVTNPIDALKMAQHLRDVGEIDDETLEGLQEAAIEVAFSHQGDVLEAMGEFRNPEGSDDD